MVLATALTRGLKWGRRLALFLLPLLAVMAAAVAILYVVGALPQRLRHAEMGPRSYATLAEAQEKLRLGLTLPGYFPSSIAWPPDSIVGQRRPYPMLTVTFVSQETGANALIVRKVKAETMPEGARLGLAQMERQWTATVEGRETTFIVGKAENGEAAAAAWWAREDQQFFLWTSYPIETLQRMAETMPD